MKKILFSLFVLSFVTFSACSSPASSSDSSSTNTNDDRPYGKVFVSYVFKTNGFTLRLQKMNPKDRPADAQVIFGNGACFDYEKQANSANCNLKTDNISDLDVTDLAGKTLNIFEVFVVTVDGVDYTGAGEEFNLQIPAQVRGEDVHKTFTYNADMVKSTFN